MNSGWLAMRSIVREPKGLGAKWKGRACESTEFEGDALIRHEALHKIDCLRQSVADGRPDTYSIRLLPFGPGRVFKGYRPPPADHSVRIDTLAKQADLWGHFSCLSLVLGGELGYIPRLRLGLSWAAIGKKPYINACSPVAR